MEKRRKTVKSLLISGLRRDKNWCHKNWKIRESWDKMQQIFIIEDELKLRQELITVLSKNGYQCQTTERYEDAAEEILKANPDLVLLDINLPVADGFNICKELRISSKVPIIIVTSRDSSMDEVFALHVGADDFITKPYNVHVLIARIERLLQRATQEEGKELTFTHKGVVLDIRRSEAIYQGNKVELTKNELGILRVLMENKGSIIPRNELIRELWEQDEFVEDATLTVNINRLRKKLEEIGVEDFLFTRRGLGYQV